MSLQDHERSVGYWLARIGLAFLLIGVPVGAVAQGLPNITPACCQGRQCTQDNVIQCVLSGGKPALGPCIPIVTCAVFGAQGACCSLFGCTDGPEATCFGTFMEGASCDNINSCYNLPPRGACCGIINQCSDTLEDACDGFGETWVQGSTCSTADCGFLGANGACCTANGGCTDGILGSGTACGVQGGEFHPGKSCDDLNQCKPPSGACCAQGACTETDEASCDGNGGIFAEGLQCAAGMCAVSQPDGACCTPDGKCAEVKTEDCLTGSFHTGASCSDADICDTYTPPETGACCVDADCKELTHAQCNTAAGAYNGDNTSCQDAGIQCTAPTAQGACCTDNGCTEGDETQCPDGTWHEDASCQELGICVKPKVACCGNDLKCTMMDEDACIQSGGTPSGNACTSGICGTPPGVCCVNEQPTQDDAGSCKGTFVNGVTQANVDCTGKGIMGGCCLDNGTCSDSTQDTCQQHSGSWNATTCADGRTCDIAESEGACCDTDGCHTTREGDCNGTFNAGATCSKDICPLPDDTGACCAGASCSVVTQDACDDKDGVFTPDADCGDVATICPGALEGACCVDDQCTQTAQHTCTTHGGSFHQGADCSDDAVCGDTSEPTEPDEPDEPTEPDTPEQPDEVAVTGGGIGSCNAGGGQGNAPWTWMVMLGLGLVAIRRRRTSEAP